MPATVVVWTTVPFCDCTARRDDDRSNSRHDGGRGRGRTNDNADGSVGDGGASWRRRSDALQRQIDADGGENPNKNVPIEDMRAYIDSLKQNAYGKSWKKRGALRAVRASERARRRGGGGGDSLGLGWHRTT
jgi:hypothetical protein